MCGRDWSSDVCSSDLPASREPEVLGTMATVVSRLGDSLTKAVPEIFDAVFECTLEMINKDFEEYPEHRTEFFTLLQAVNSHCFAGSFCLIRLSPTLRMSPNRFLSDCIGQALKIWVQSIVPRRTSLLMGWALNEIVIHDDQL